MDQENSSQLSYSISSIGLGDLIGSGFRMN